MFLKYLKVQSIFNWRMCLPLDYCCFCVRLDVGAKIISIINLIGSVVIAMVYGTAAMLPPPVAETRRIVYAIIATVAMFKLLIGCLLIYGVFGKKPRLILPWLVTCWVSVIFLLALSVLGTVLVRLYTVDQDTTREVNTMAAVYCSLAVVLYCFGSVVSSRRDEILQGHYTDSAQRLMRRDFNKSPLYNVSTYN